MTYKSYSIESESDLWALKYGYHYKIVLGNGERVLNFKSIDDAKEWIDDQQ